jgi:hypothetical protein
MADLEAEGAKQDGILILTHEVVEVGGARRRGHFSQGQGTMTVTSELKRKKNSKKSIYKRESNTRNEGI